METINEDKLKKVKEKYDFVKISNEQEEDNDTSHLLRLHGMECLCKKSLSLITGQKGCGKSNFIGLLAVECCKANTKMLIFDTEQPEADVRRILRRTMKTAGFSINEKWENKGIAVYSLLNVEEDDRKKLVLALADEEKPDIIVIDNLGDLVQTINDENEAKETRKWLIMLGTELYCAVVCVLHQNHGETKVGGWLGTVIEKASTEVFSLENKKGLFSVTHKSRSYGDKKVTFKITKSDKDSVGTWSFDSGEHAENDVPNEKEDLQKIANGLNLPCTHTALVEQIMKKTKKSESTAKRKIEKMIQENILKKPENKGGEYKKGSKFKGSK